MKALKLIFKNILEFFLISWAILTIVFFLINSIPASSSLTSITNETSKKAIEAKYHLNDPLIIRYFIYLKNIFLLDFGISMSFLPGADLNSFVWTRFGTSMTIGVIALAITLLIGIPLGVFVGMKPGKIVDTTATVVTSILISIPAIIFAIILLLIGKKVGIPYVYSSNSFLTWILPALALGLSPIVSYIRYIRVEMNREINSMHAKFAALKGAKRSRFVWRHALKPSLFPVITFLPGAVLTVFIGGLFTEKVFQVPGSGGLMVSAIQTNDYNIVLFMTVVNSMTTVLAYSIRDVLYNILDPRVKGVR